MMTKVLNFTNQNVIFEDDENRVNVDTWGCCLSINRNEEGVSIYIHNHGDGCSMNLTDDEFETLCDLVVKRIL